MNSQEYLYFFLTIPNPSRSDVITTYHNYLYIHLTDASLSGLKDGPRNEEKTGAESSFYKNHDIHNPLCKPERHERSKATINAQLVRGGRRLYQTKEDVFLFKF